MINNSKKKNVKKRRPIDVYIKRIQYICTCVYTSCTIYMYTCMHLIVEIPVPRARRAVKVL